MNRKSYPSDVSDEEWQFAAPYLTLMTLSAPQREHDLREVFNALRYLVRSGAAWRYVPNDFPRWDAVYRQTQRWLRAGCFEAMAHDLRELLRVLQGRKAKSTAAVYDSRTLSSSCESGSRAGFDGHKKRNGSKIHIAVDTLGHLLTLLVTPANQGDRTQVAALSQAVQEATGQSVEIAFVDQGYSGENAAAQAQHEALCFMLSNSKKPNTGLFCCLVAGLSSAALDGRAASDAWLKIMSGSPKPLPHCTSWLLPASCLNNASTALQVRNTL